MRTIIARAQALVCASILCVASPAAVGNPYGGPDSVHRGGNLYVEPGYRQFRAGDYTVRLKPRLNREQTAAAARELKARSERIGRKIEAARNAPLISGPSRGMEAVIADARRQLGTRPSLATLQQWGREVGSPWPLKTNRLYCAIGLNRALKQAGIQTARPNPHHVSSFRAWGVPSRVEPGAVVVISGRGLREAHVGIVTSVSGGTMRLLSWNGSGGLVTEENVSVRAVAFARRPVERLAATDPGPFVEASLGGGW